jgi:hypothetical protein
MASNAADDLQDRTSKPPAAARNSSSHPFAHRTRSASPATQHEPTRVMSTVFHAIPVDWMATKYAAPAREPDAATS